MLVVGVVVFLLLGVTQVQGYGALQFTAKIQVASCKNCVKLGDVVTVIAGEEVQDGHSFSFEVWVKVRDLNHGMGWVFMHAGPCSHNQCAFFGFDGNRAAVFGFVLNDLSVSGSFQSDVGKWVHWAGTFDSATSERVLYRNGVEVGRDVSTKRYSPHSNDLHIGQDNWANNPFRGDVASLRLWDNLVLSSQEIQAHICERIVSDHPHFQNLAFTLDWDDTIPDTRSDTSIKTLSGQTIQLNVLPVVDGWSVDDCPIFPPLNTITPPSPPPPPVQSQSNTASPDSLPESHSPSLSSAPSPSSTSSSSASLTPPPLSRTSSPSPPPSTSPSNTPSNAPAEFPLDPKDCDDRDCVGVCRTQEWITLHLKDGVCDAVLDCEHFDFDHGDCVHEPEEASFPMGFILMILIVSVAAAAVLYFVRPRRRGGLVPLHHGWEA